MNEKEEYKALVEKLKFNAKSRGEKLRNEDIATVLGYNRAYFSSLLGDRGVVTNDHITDIKLRFPELSDNTTIQTHETVPDLSFLEKRRVQKTKSEPYMVPFIPVKAQAGYVKAIDQEVYLDTLEKFALPPMVDPRGAIWRYWEIEGDSMEPVFRAGDIILTSFVHPYDWENLKNFYTYVIVTRDESGGGRVMIKRIFCKNQLEWVLISENEERYPQQLLPVEYVKEVWIYRKTWKTDASPTKKFEIKV